LGYLLRHLRDKDRCPGARGDSRGESRRESNEPSSRWHPRRHLGGHPDSP
jgi:hypothetical protein